MEQQAASGMGITGTTLEGRDPDAFKYNIDYHRFSSFLGVEAAKRTNRDLAQKIAVIYDWAKEQTGKDDGVTIMNAVRNYQKNLGVTFSGETLVNHLYRNVRLDATGKIAKQKSEVRATRMAKEKAVVLNKKVNLKDVINKKVGPTVKKIEKAVQQALESSIDRSIKGVLKGLSK